MAIKNRLLRGVLIALPLFIGLVSLLDAQSAGYYLDPDSEVPRFIQRLAWTGGEYTSRYEVIIERQEGSTYRRHQRGFTEENFLDVSLPPGQYRFCVIPYDLLDKPADGTDWVNIEVHRALQPELVASSQSNIKLGPNNNFVLNIQGYDIDPDAGIFLRTLGGRYIASHRIDFDEEGNALAYFDSKLLIEGEYEAYVQNPGGLDDVIEGIYYTPPEPPFYVNIVASWMPLFKPFGESPDWNMSLIGAGLRISMVHPTSSIYIGPELKMSWYKLPDTELVFEFFDENGNVYTEPMPDFEYFPNEKKPGAHVLAAELGLLIGKRMSNKNLAFNFRVAGGYAVLIMKNVYDDPMPEFENIMGIVCASVGTSFFLRIMKNFTFEIGVDYLQLFNEDFNGFMRPFIGFGVQF